MLGPVSTNIISGANVSLTFRDRTLNLWRHFSAIYAQLDCLLSGTDFFTDNTPLAVQRRHACFGFRSKCLRFGYLRAWYLQRDTYITNLRLWQPQPIFPVLTVSPHYQFITQRRPRLLLCKVSNSHCYA